MENVTQKQGRKLPFYSAVLGARGGGEGARLLLARPNLYLSARTCLSRSVCASFALYHLALLQRRRFHVKSRAQHLDF